MLHFFKALPTYRVHVQNMLLQIELVGKVAITLDAKFGLSRFPSFALVAAGRGLMQRFGAM